MVVVRPRPGLGPPARSAKRVVRHRDDGDLPASPGSHRGTPRAGAARAALAGAVGESLGGRQEPDRGGNHRGQSGGEQVSAEPRVVIVGGGLAGMSAALACVDGGARVTLLEARPRLGGATFSFQREGLWVDNGQHVYLRCCTAYRRFLSRIGAEGKTFLQPRMAIPVRAPDGTSGWLRRGSLPAPLHLARTLMRYPFLRP